MGLCHFGTSTSSIISLSLIEPGVDLLLEAGIENLRAKSLRQSAYLIELWQQKLASLDFTLNSPHEESLRGSHISLGHPEFLRIDLALINDLKVLPDFRAPNNIRLGITLLYTTFADIYETIIHLQKIVTEKIYEKYTKETPIVT